MNSYDIGDLVRITGWFQNGLIFVDPTEVKIKTKSPLGAVTTFTYGVDSDLIKDATGKYHLDIAPTVQGVWTYRIEGNGNNKAASEVPFHVVESQFD